MAVYAIGDVQGCFDPLQRLLAKLAFDPSEDTLWFCGDLVNRGPQSLEVLRLVRRLGDRAITVLGNHDLHLLALANGNLKKRADKLLDAVLKAPDGDELLHWLRHRPLMHSDKELGFSMIHAGLPPQWGRKLALACASEVERSCATMIRARSFLPVCTAINRRSGTKTCRGSTACGLSPTVSPGCGIVTWTAIWDCVKKAVRAARARDFCPGSRIPDRKSRKFRVLFGHWSTLGYLAGENVWSLDTGCVWGRQLTALRIDVDPPRPRHLDCKDSSKP